MALLFKLTLSIGSNHPISADQHNLNALLLDMGRSITQTKYSRAEIEYSAVDQMPGGAETCSLILSQDESSIP